MPAEIRPKVSEAGASPGAGVREGLALGMEGDGAREAVIVVVVAEASKAGAADDEEEVNPVGLEGEDGIAASC